MGRYPMRNGHPYYWSHYQSKAGSRYALHPDEITLAEMLRPVADPDNPERVPGAKPKKQKKKKVVQP